MAGCSPPRSSAIDDLQVSQYTHDLLGVQTPTSYKLRGYLWVLHQRQFDMVVAPTIRMRMCDHVSECRKPREQGVHSLETVLGSYMHNFPVIAYKRNTR